MEQKVRRIGNSAGIILPRETLRKAGLGLGAAVAVEVRPNGDIILRRLPRAEKSPISASVARRLERFIEAYRPALEKLAE